MKRMIGAQTILQNPHGGRKRSFILQRSIHFLSRWRIAAFSLNGRENRSDLQRIDMNPLSNLEHLHVQGSKNAADSISGKSAKKDWKKKIRVGRAHPDQ